MLCLEENELITRTGPGTLMGDLFRQYWLPALLSSELPEPDGEPVRVMMLGEPLIAFRDSYGKVGLLQNHCPHRGASLFYGRNEEAGLQCVYHGWKFDTSGSCVDMPNEPAESDFKQKVRTVAYPTQERGGVVWTYMGPREKPPALPQLEANMMPDDQIWTSVAQRNCNWLQAMEGDIDTTHAGFLHGGASWLTKRSGRADTSTPSTWRSFSDRNRSAKFAVLETPGGDVYTAWRDADPGYDYHRVGQFVLPSLTMTPNGILGRAIHASFTVPLDDTHCLRYWMNPNVETGRSMYRADPAQPGLGRSEDDFLPNSTGWLGRYRLMANAENDYLVDRQRQRSKQSFTGIPGTVQQDTAATESEGPIYDRRTEHLGTTDVMIIQVRRRLLDAARALAEDGRTPPGVEDPDVYAVRSGEMVLPQGVSWIAATEDLRRGFVDHPELDRFLTVWSGIG
jgi:phenylpropionate dioxygenase-like ring-hydroxylating dioxygenase large terminal subunit